MEDQPCKVGEQEGSFLAARWAEEEAFAREGRKLLVAAFRVHTSDAGHALAVVAAGEEAGHRAFKSSPQKVFPIKGVAPRPTSRA